MIEIQGEPYLSAAEACELLGVKPATLYAHVSRGVLKSYRQGIKRARLYRRGDVQRACICRQAGAPVPSPTPPTGWATPSGNARTESPMWWLPGMTPTRISRHD